MRTTAVQDFSQLKGKIFIEKRGKILNQAGLKKNIKKSNGADIIIKNEI